MSQLNRHPQQRAESWVKFRSENKRRLKRWKLLPALVFVITPSCTVFAFSHRALVSHEIPLFYAVFPLFHCTSYLFLYTTLQLAAVHLIKFIALHSFLFQFSHCLSYFGSCVISLFHRNRAAISHTLFSKTQQAVNNLQEQLNLSAGYWWRGCTPSAY